MPALKSKHKAISIKGDRHQPYSHVIFLMKAEATQPPVVDFVAEAERIMAGGYKRNHAHIEESGGVKKVIIRESAWQKMLLHASMLMAAAGIVAMFLYLL